ncbi:hypothetical protein HY29_05235 [Hyphomonas beringensis]|uniref:MaoC-like domain-containing protein n=1 Tax=Hyphomonas beringensis TaxID=1280946 RepID=A0A062U0Y0_9PROT|nr:MaoC family dehydratase [Hyphomonas beringensis]KCZ51942.1 hypothetical protein HY29_05235 [Hyphomonas beringensis]
MSVRLLEELVEKTGQELGVSPWVQISQEQVNRFADVTIDPDWMHIDVERAKRGPVGQTIGQGFLTLSLLTHFSHALDFLPEDVVYAYNYGLDRVRWIEPVPVGSRIRNRMRLLEVRDRGDRQYLIKTENHIEIENRDRPAMIAEWLGLLQGAQEGQAYEAW